MDRILAKARANLCKILHFERNGQRTGPQHESEVLRRLQVLASHRDLTARPNGTLNNRRLTHHSLIEHDRHVILDVPGSLSPKAARTFIAHDEFNEVSLRRRRIGLRAGEVFAGDDRLRVQHIEWAIGSVRIRERIAAPPNHLAGRQRGDDLRHT